MAGLMPWKLSLAGETVRDLTKNCGVSGVRREKVEEERLAGPDTLDWVEMPSMLVTRSGESSSLWKKLPRLRCGWPCLSCEGCFTGGRDFSEVGLTQSPSRISSEV